MKRGLKAIKKNNLLLRNRPQASMKRGLKVIHIWYGVAPLLFSLNEKRIERLRSMRYDKVIRISTPQWKEDWKFIFLSPDLRSSEPASMKRGLKAVKGLGRSSYKRLPQWKEDWKNIREARRRSYSTHASMKRGLKGRLYVPIKLCVYYGLNEKRIERRIVYGGTTIAELRLNEKRIESICQVWIASALSVWPQWKEDWKLLWQMMHMLSPHLCLNEKRIERLIS
mgnify:CR=1 FL=1